ADGTVTATAVDGQGNLYIGGVLTKVGNTDAHCIAKWDGRQWSTLGGGMDYGVHGFAFSADGSVYASGAFIWATNTDGTPVTVYGIAKWDGERWSGLGGGVTGGVFGYFFVHALAVSGTNLYAGGYFSAMGGVPAQYIVRCNGGTWSSVGSGMDDIVYTLKVFGGNLHAGGIFTMADGVSANRIARWDGNGWSALGSGTSPDSGGGADVRALATWGTNLYAGGNFGAAGGKISLHVARAVLGDAPGHNQLVG